MMKHLKKIIYLFVFALVLAACKGEDGEPGPAGEQGEPGAKGDTGAAGTPGSGFEKMGSFQGTVAGNRTDGTAFSEAFKFEYGDNTSGFYDENGSKYIDLYRYEKPSDESSAIGVGQLKFESNSLVVDPQNTSINFAFEKELSVTDLFLLRARPYFKDTEAFILAISDEKNKDFNFSYESSGEINYNSATYFDGTNDVPTYAFYVSISNASILAHYRQSNGNLLGIYDYSVGQLITSGTQFDQYNKLVFKNNAALSKLTFYDKATNTSLHASIPFVPADQFTVTNYVHDGTTGNLSFNFVMKISKYRKRNNSSSGRNTTGNDLTITGTFNSGGKVYKNIVSRRASGG